MAASSFRLRLRYTKLGRLSYLSHLELIRCLERCIRRASLPYEITQGFSPHMKHAFGWALPVGVGSICEYADIWISSYIEPDKVLKAFERAVPEGLEILEAFYVDPKGDSLEVSYPCSRYEVLFELAKQEQDAISAVSEALEKLLKIGHIKVLRKKKEKIVKFEGLLLAKPEIVGIETEPDADADAGAGVDAGAGADVDAGAGADAGADADAGAGAAAGADATSSNSGVNTQSLASGLSGQAPAGNRVLMCMETFTEGKGSLRPDLFVNAMVELSDESIKRLSIIRTSQYSL